MEDCLFACGSPQYMDNAIKSGFYYGLMIRRVALGSVFLGSNSFVMEMKLGPNLGSKGENRQQQKEPDL